MSSSGECCECGVKPGRVERGSVAWIRGRSCWERWPAIDLSDGDVLVSASGTLDFVSGDSVSGERT